MRQKSKNKLNHILESNTWLAPYHIMDDDGEDFIIRFENDDDADRFAKLCKAHGGTIKDSGYIN